MGGVDLAKRWLESATWVELPFDVYNNAPVCSLRRLGGKVQRYDLFGAIHTDPPTLLYVDRQGRQPCRPMGRRWMKRRPDDSGAPQKEKCMISREIRGLDFDSGLKQLVGARSGVLVTASKPSVRIRETVSSLGVTAFSIDELDRWEATHLPKALADVGSHGPGAFNADKVARTIAKGEPSLERIYWFLRSEVWFLDSWQATKRIIGALAELHKYWTPKIDDGQAAALRWMFAEALSILTLHLVALVGIYQTSDIRNWPELVRDRLAAGAIPTRNQLALADAFDKYLAHLLGELKAPSTVQIEAMGAFHPAPPDWADALIELLSRLETFPGLRDVPRQTDLVISERLVRRRHADAGVLAAVTTRDPEEFARVRRQIAAFLRGCVELPDAVDKALTA